MRNVYKILDGNSEAKWLTEIPRRILDNIKMNLNTAYEYGDMALSSSCKQGNEPSGSEPERLPASNPSDEYTPWSVSYD